MKVLIVDDSEIVSERLKAMLGEIPDVETIGQAKDPLEATRSFQGLNPDVVILDIEMRDGSGINVLQKMKSDNRSPLVIVLTNQYYSQYRKKCKDAGADFFFDKSAEFDKVAEVLKHLKQSQSADYPAPGRGAISQS